MSDDEFVIPEQINRDRFGRPLIIPEHGGPPVAYTRCTTYVNCLEDRFALGQWQQRMAVAGIAARNDLHLRAVSLGLPPTDDDTPAKKMAADVWKASMNEVVETAREAAATSAAATVGTSLHAITEAIDRGTDVNMDTIPANYRPHLDAYVAATKGLNPLHIERFSVCDEIMVGGTADRIVQIAGTDGVFIADIKTGSVEYGAGTMAMQLAVYAHSKLYDPATGARTPIEGINLERGIIIHLDAKTGVCRLHWLNIAAGWEAVALAGQVRAWRKRKDLMADATIALPVVDPKTREAIMSAIRVATCVDELTGLWQEAAVNNLWTDAMTQAAKTRKNELLQTVNVAA